jgi:hypothetical protein
MANGSSRRYMQQNRVNGQCWSILSQERRKALFHTALGTNSDIPTLTTLEAPPCCRAQAVAELFLGKGPGPGSIEFEMNTTAAGQ